MVNTPPLNKATSPIFFANLSFKLNTTKAGIMIRYISVNTFKYQPGGQKLAGCSGMT